MEIVKEFYVAHGENVDNMEIETFTTIREALEFFKTYTDGEKAVLYIIHNGVDIILEEIN